MTNCSNCLQFNFVGIPWYCSLRHFRPQKNGDSRSLARPQQKRLKEPVYQRSRDKFQKAEKLATSSRAIRLQYGVLPYRFTETNSLEVLLVTTRGISRRVDIGCGQPALSFMPREFLPATAPESSHSNTRLRGKILVDCQRNFASSV